jgi:hypothetical protein
MANKYDRIVQENFRELTVSLVNRIMDLQQVEIITLPRKIQRTLEREMDGLLRVVGISGEPFLLNLEWQSANDPKMCLRMLLYHALSAIVHELPVIGVVIYIGKEKVDMSVSMESDSLKYNYRLIDMTELNPESFLESDIPEEVIMAVLAGKPKNSHKREIIKKILHKLRLLLCHDNEALHRRLEQFEIIGELRDVQKIIIEEEKNMALTYNIEKDIRYNQGLEKGIANEKYAFVKNLLLHTRHSDEEIGKLVNTTGEFVSNVKKSIMETSSA